MGINNFVVTKDDDDTGSGPGGGPGGPGGAGPGFPMPPMPSMSASPSDVEDMLIDYNERFKGADPALFREALVAQAISVLIGKAKPNPLLVGPAGVGKTRIVEEIARLIAVGDPQIPDRLKKSTVFELPLSSIVAGAGIVGQLEERLAELVNFATDKANDAIIFIDEIHLIQDSHDPTYKKVSQILKPALARGDMRLIGATTMNEARAFDNDPAFQRRFSRLVVDELTRDQTITVLFAARGSYASHYGNKVTISDADLVKLATIADENSRASAHRPDNALTLLDRAMADVVVSHSTAVGRAVANGDQVTAGILRSMATLPLVEKRLRSVAVRLMTGMASKEPFNEARVLAGLTRIKGQSQITDGLVEALRRDDLGAFPRKKPLAWMLAGPSGVGKTEVSKIISAELTAQPPIILNMGEFSNEHDISRIIGSGPGYVGSESDKELPFDTLESNPYRVILLDELEKAHRSVHRLFLTALDEGWMRMASGKIIDFSKAVIIATTNAAREALDKAPMGFSSQVGPPVISAQDLVSKLKEHFDAEFLGRFSETVAFAPIDARVYAEILTEAYARERARIDDGDPVTGAMIPSAIDPALLERTVAATYLREQGARPAERAARRLIEDAILAGRHSSAAAQPTASPAAIVVVDDEEQDAPA